MPGVGADEAVPGLDDQHAALGAQHLAALLEDQLDQGRLLAERSAPSLRASSPGMHARRAAGSVPRPWRRPSARRRRRRRRRARRARRDQLAERASPPSSPAGRRPAGAAPRQPSVAALISPAPSRFAPRGRGRASSSRVRATTSAGVSRSRPSEASSSTPKGTPAVAGGGDVALAAALAEGGADRVRRAPGPARWCPVPWRSGTIGDVGLGDAGQQVVELTRVEQRAVAGEEHDAARRRRPRPRAIPASAASEWPRVGEVGEQLGARRRRRAPRARGSSADHDRPLDRARRADRLEHVVEHRRDQRRAALVARSPRRGATSPRRSASRGGSRSLSPSVTIGSAEARSAA